MTQVTQEKKKEKSGTLYAEHETIYARSVQGKLFDNLRVAAAVLTQIVFYGLVWLPWNDRQALLFHLVERKFYLFGLVFWPQDVIYLAILLIIMAYALFLVTALAGRVFCGYACPQTVYTEIYMWIEKWIEGDRAVRMKRDKGPFTATKARLKLTKHVLWLAVALWTSFTLVGYFTPMTELIHNFKTWTLGPWETFWIFFYAGFLYMMAGFMREQVCLYMCPYARFQSAMFDRDTLIVSYDEARGEPRGARKKGADDSAKGDCVDCGICVQVCPTGIDIRNGLQYECIGCAACIDGCDEVMEKVGLPKGLVRYTTENALAGTSEHGGVVGHIIRPRVVIYTVILMAILGATTWALNHRLPLKVDVLRDRTILSREADDGRIENIYTLRVINTDEKPHTYNLTVTGLKGIGINGATHIDVPSASSRTVSIAVRADQDNEPKGSNQIFFDIIAADSAALNAHEKSTFMLPR
ncbi:MAG: cytochrome c oxidase accessory protein CcoG [Rhodocyclaceae bacterium]|nr:cytochrome c oxidase accessory protein CcoG [Rhodocyclaceae bacterium]